MMSFSLAITITLRHVNVYLETAGSGFYCVGQEQCDDKLLILLSGDIRWGDELNCVCLSEFKALKNYSRNRYSRSLSMTNNYPGNQSLAGWDQPMRDESEDEFSGMGGDPNAVVTPNSVKVTHRSVMLVFFRVMIWCSLTKYDWY